MLILIVTLFVFLLVSSFFIICLNDKNEYLNNDINLFKNRNKLLEEQLSRSFIILMTSYKKEKLHKIQNYILNGISEHDKEQEFVKNLLKKK